MIAGIYFDSQKWFDMLRQHGCELVAGAPVFHGETQDYRIWKTPWDHKFLAPSRCTYSEADDIIAREITGTKPPLH